MPNGLRTPNQPNVPDRNFVRAAAAGGLSEVELGQLAEHEGQSSAVREFGQRMVSDHSKANAHLKELAAAAGIPLPDTPDAAHRMMREQLDLVHGAAFDRTYIAANSSITSRRRSSSNTRSVRGRMRG